MIVTLYRFGEVSLTESVVGKLASKAVFLGASGVDLFFVLSGFLITGILLDQKGSQKYFARFYSRRSLRIFPLYFATLVCVLYVIPWLVTVITKDNSAASSITNSITGNTLHLWLYTTNLAIAWANAWQFGMLDHFWSLAIEEQFYLVWPWLVLNLPTKQLWKMCLAACVILSISRIAFAYSTDLEVTAKTFTLFRFDGLLLGAASAAFLRDTSVASLVSVPKLRTGVVVLGMLYGLTLIQGKNDLTIRYTLVSLAGAMLLLSALHVEKGALERRLLESPLLRSLGKYSYAMYVFQLPLVTLIGSWVSPARYESLCGAPIVGAVLYVISMFAVTYLLSVLSWHFFEWPILRLRDRIFRT